MKIIIAGSSGFVGIHLVEYFEKQGHTLVLLSRNPSRLYMHFWDPERGEIDPLPLEGADVVINLCGESIFGRWNQHKKEKIRSSRLIPTQFLCRTLLELKVPPNVYIGASAVGYYGDQPGKELDETASPGKDFLSEVCEEWEKFAAPLTNHQIRVALVRFGIILGKEGGALKYIDKAFNTGMGGTLGSGEQIMSWIAIDDVCRAIEFICTHQISGPVNLTSPKSVSNAEFTRTVGTLLNRPTVVTVPKFALKMLFGEGAEVFLSSIDAKPRRLLESGFQFQHSNLEEALKKYLLTF